ncbi:MAG: hypothetical protein KF774_19225 [Planctomyces sp.]|nr:hypothetical protein [Planctomyces sp.]
MIQIQHFQSFSISNIRFLDDMESLELETIDTCPPYQTGFMRFNGVLWLSVSRDNCGPGPHTVCDMTIDCPPDYEAVHRLATFGYAFKSSLGAIPSGLMFAHMEGDICGDIVAQRVAVRLNRVGGDED